MTECRKAGTLDGFLRLAGLVMLLLVPLLARPVQADTLTRIAADGVLRAGTREQAFPFAYRDESGQLVGFSVDLLREITKVVEEKLGRPLELQLAPVTPLDRLERVAAGELDIVCEITTPTWSREHSVDFSIPFFRDGTRILTYRDKLHDGMDIGQMQIAVARGTTTEGIITTALPAARIRTYDSMGAAMQAFVTGEVDGVANIGVVLLGLARQSSDKRSVVLLPRTTSLGTEAMACILPQNDSAWRDLVNTALIRLYDGVDQFRGPYVELYDRWFGRNGKLVYPLDRATGGYLKTLDMWAR